MTSEHFTRDDFAGIITAIFLFTPFLFTPGFVLGWVLDVLGFRKEPLVWRLLLSVPLSISVFPILNFLIGSYVSMTALWVLYGALATGFAGILLFERRERTQESRLPRWLIWAPIVWAATIVLCGVDIQWGDRLYPPTLIFDFNIRTAFIESITRHGLPAINPLFYPNHFVPLRYHYFWFIDCSLVDQLGGSIVSARHALTASAVWCGFGLISIIPLYLRFFHPRAEKAIWQRSAWGIALCVVSGLDILPTLFFYSYYWIAGTGWTPHSPEFWNELVAPLAHSTMWVAHHVASLLALLTGFLILFSSPKQKSVKHVLQLILVGLAFASSVGLSVYVSFVFAVFLAVWVGFLMYSREYAGAGWLCSAGLLAAVCLAPYLFMLRSAGGPSGPFLSPTVRSFAPLNMLLPVFGYTWNQVAVANFFAIPLNYFLEFGVMFVMASILVRRFWRRRRRLVRAECAAALMFATSLLICTFVRSGVIANNDLGWRGMLMAEFLLLLWSPDLFRAWRRAGRRLIHGVTPKPAGLLRWNRRVSVLLAIGIATAAVDFFLTRTYFLLDDLSLVGFSYWIAPQENGTVVRARPSNIGRRSFAMRQIYSSLQRLTPLEATIQGHPNQWNDVYHGLYASRQDVSFDDSCGSYFGGNPRECEAMRSELWTLFNDPTAASQIAIDELCARRHIDTLVVNDVDPVFREKASWVWHRVPVLKNQMARAFACGAFGQLNANAPEIKAPQLR